MAAYLKHLGRRKEWTRDGEAAVYTYEGTEAEIDALIAQHTIGEVVNDGALVSMTKSQIGGTLWNAELRYEISGGGGGSATPPSNAWGSKSATLRGSVLAIPLANHSKYRANWDHYLAAAPGTPDTPPNWWATADSVALSEALSLSYAWIGSPGELPSGPTGRWRLLKTPTKPGYTTYDVATYSITETAKYKTATAAGNAIAGKLNHVGSPSEKFGISGGNWKCDDASVQWDGKRWLGTTTWTRSGDNKGWDKDLYDD